ncbi:MAG: 50S ribosomal protein L4 [Bacilli bacterium]|nr:50S ribosomal protein L4 [Bacilli bacterium]
MSKQKIFNLKGEKVKDINLKDNIWDTTPNDAVLHNAIVLNMANTRQASASTKTRSEVRGGGRKPWRQKGTGNARQGSIRATQWRGGGIVFGPNPNKNYKKKMNKKERRIALLSALSYKVKDNELIVVENLKFETSKTKEMTNVLKTFNIDTNKVLVVINELEDNICLAARNLANVKVVLPEEVNSFDLVSADNMIITTDALKKLEEVLSND